VTRIALLHMRERWPELRFKMTAEYLERDNERQAALVARAACSGLRSKPD
jgi:3-oxoacyl-[acyl-carrier-protein] synthase III